jgi:hypothetical protein
VSPARVHQLRLSRRALAGRVLLLTASAWPSACGAPSDLADPGTFLDHLSGELPESISELGLYADPSERAQVHPRAQRYSPAQPLWSSGSQKERHIVLPEGAAVDSSDGQAWSFPVGTLLLKTFSYPDPEQPSGLRAIETRVLRREAEGFSYAVYLWSDDGSAAELLDLSRTRAVPVELEGELFEHVVPARLDCRKCHESQAVPVLGFDELGLDAPLDPAPLESAPSESAPTQLESFLQAGLLSHPPASPPQVITHDDPQTERVLSYLEGNCTHCHNGGDRASAAFDLRHPVALANLIDQQTQGDALSGVRVVSGQPDQSALFLAFSRADIDGIQPMPPVGVDRVDQAALELFESWIASLPGD